MKPDRLPPIPADQWTQQHNASMRRRSLMDHAVR